MDSPKAELLPLVGLRQNYLMVYLIVFAMRVSEWIIYYLFTYELGFNCAIGWIDSQCVHRWCAPS